MIFLEKNALLTPFFHWKYKVYKISPWEWLPTTTMHYIQFECGTPNESTRQFSEQSDQIDGMKYPTMCSQEVISKKHDNFANKFKVMRSPMHIILCHSLWVQCYIISGQIIMFEKYEISVYLLGHCASSLRSSQSIFPSQTTDLGQQPPPLKHLNWYRLHDRHHNRKYIYIYIYIQLSIEKTTTTP